MAFRFRRPTPVITGADGQVIRTIPVGIRSRTQKVADFLETKRTATTVQTNTSTTEELTPVPVITPQPEGNADPAATTEANVDAKATAAKDLALAELRLKNANGEIASQEASIARQQAELPRKKYLSKALALGNIRSQQKIVDGLKKKVEELQVEIDRLKALV